MAVPVIDADALARLLPMRAAIDALHAGFGAEHLPEAPLRTHVETQAGALYLMPASGPQGVGVKLVTLTGANTERGLPFIHAVYALFDAATQAPVAILDGAVAHGAADGGGERPGDAVPRARGRAPPGAVRRRGAGPFAPGGHAGRPSDRGGRRRVPLAGARRARWLRMRRRSGWRARIGEPGAERDADIVCTCTTSETPVVVGHALAGRRPRERGRRLPAVDARGRHGGCAAGRRWWSRRGRRRSPRRATS